MTRTEFINKWKFEVCGLALYGLVIDATKGPLQRATHAFETPQKVEELLARLYADLCPPPPIVSPPPPARPAAPPPAPQTRRPS